MRATMLKSDSTYVRLTNDESVKELGDFNLTFSEGMTSSFDIYLTLEQSSELILKLMEIEYQAKARNTRLLVEAEVTQAISQ